MKLAEQDRARLAGDEGPAMRMALSVVVQMAEVLGAPELMNVTAAHVDSSIYIGEAGLEFAERLVELGARVSVPTTLNVSGLDEHHWQEWPVPAEWAEKAHRQMVAYQRMGCSPTWTCAPYQVAPRPVLGQQIVWGESSAIAFANSVLGARTERYPDLLDICCAITGRVPAVGLHLTENRAAQVVLRLAGVPRSVQAGDAFYPVLGYLVGRLARDRIPVLAGLQVVPTEDQLKALCAAAASSGSVALFHVAGVTPEAPTLEAALQGRAPLETVDVTMSDLEAARHALATAESDGLDMVVVGCPHLSLREFRRLAELVKGKQAHPQVQFLVAASRAVVQQAGEAGYLAGVQGFGGKVVVDTCILATPMLPPGVRRLMTHSGKCAYYAPGLLGVQVAFGSLADCVRSAVEGRVVVDEAEWAG